MAVYYQTIEPVDGRQNSADFNRLVEEGLPDHWKLASPVLKERALAYSDWN